MSTKIIKAALAADNAQFRTPAQVRAAIPGQYATDGDVPLYLYTSLKDLLYPGSTQSQFEAILIETYGIGATPEDAGIHISTLPIEQINKVEGMRSDKIGAEIAMLSILTQIGDNLTDAQKDSAEQIDLRIRMVLDYNARVMRRRSGETTLTPALSAAADPTIVNNISSFPVICTWDGFLNNETAIAKASLYRLQYFRVIV